MRTLSRACTILLLVFAPLVVTAQPSPVQTAQRAPALDALIPFDTAVTTGTLPNGLTYFIRHNGRPANRVLLRLAVKAGSIDETDSQQGLAHVLEHMAFDGTEHFKPGELVAFFESTGMQMGPHLNAYTSFDETVYMFEVPTDKEGLVAKGLLALADFAERMTLDPKQIDKERGVVMEEWRQGLGAATRVRDKQIPVLYHGSKYAERLPIGKPEILKTFPPERLRAFYTTWYRPDRMALIVVGDIDPKALADEVKTTFGVLTNPATPAPDRHYPVPIEKGTLVSVATDPEVTRSSVSLVRKRPREPESHVGDYRRGLVERLADQIFQERFQELARKPDAPFLGASAYQSALSHDVATYTTTASVQEGKIEQGLSALAIESKRVRQFGFGAAELDRAKKWTMASYERAYGERDKTESGSFAQEYLNYFLDAEPSPGIEYEFSLVKQLLPGITAEEVSDRTRAVLNDVSSVVLAVEPQKPSLAVPTDAQIDAALARAEQVSVTPWTETATAKQIMEKTPAPGKIVDRREISAIGVTVVRFANGVEAWFKPTDFKNDQILFTMYSRGGTSLAEPAKYPEASLSGVYVNLSGAGGFKALDLQKMLAGQLGSASPFLSLSTHGISGSSTPSALETAMQLLYLDFTAPGDDPDAFALLKKQLQSAVI
ncbi:MAG TPA: pitrilysin family protein, partial [Gemmatimonadaceae bacterium]|nr:pitrilysin family protein [Gemmatimonadaceae bacterium]